MPERAQWDGEVFPGANSFSLDFLMDSEIQYTALSTVSTQPKAWLPQTTQDEALQCPPRAATR